MSTPFYDDGRTTVYLGDCIDVMRELPDSSVDSIVTDPPYGLGFMGKAWDALPPGLPWALECYRVLKPGGHLLAFGGTRTWHRLAVAVEDAGFEIRDSIAWLYGSGFPKSMDVSKAIDKAAGHWRGRAGEILTGNSSMENPNRGRTDKGDAITPDAVKWQGWGTALKPAFEPVVVGRKPLGKGMTVAANVLEHGTGALNIDASRVGSDGGSRSAQDATPNRLNAVYGDGMGGLKIDPTAVLGRWPANVMLDESQAAELDAQAPKTGAAAKASGPTLRGRHDTAVAYGARNGLQGEPSFHGDLGGASRFFYVAKAPKSERPSYVDEAGVNHAHATVKPLSLMRQLVRLVTPPDGIVLEPFAGSGTTVEAAIVEDFRVIAIERELEYWPFIAQRIARANGLD